MLRCGLFAGMDGGQAEALLACLGGQRMDYEKNAVLWRAGEPVQLIMSDTGLVMPCGRGRPSPGARRQAPSPAKAVLQGLGGLFLPAPWAVAQLLE